MHKIKLYLDTSVISHIEAPHKPQAEIVTKRFFGYVEEHYDEYELVISPVVLFEIDRCPGPKQSRLIALMKRLPFCHLQESTEMFELANRYVEHNVLIRKHIRDLMHVAHATVSRCNFVVSWNMKHLVNPQTMIRVNAVNRFMNYPDVIIVTPRIILGEHYDDGV